MRKIWTTEEIDYLKQNYANTATHVVAAKLDRSLSSVFGMATVLDLHKSEEFRNSPLSGRIRPGANLGGTTRFKKGQKSWNKGKKLGSQWSTPGMKQTQFKKGITPHNTKNDGAISTRIVKGRPYKYIRIAKARWRELHRVLWEQVHGPIPKGMNVQFKDKDSLNCTIENLYLIDRHNQMKDNSIHNLPAELKTTIRTLATLNRKINTYEKHNQRSA